MKTVVGILTEVETCGLAEPNSAYSTLKKIFIKIAVLWDVYGTIIPQYMASHLQILYKFSETVHHIKEK
jgi:hypothetical protein